MKIVVVAMIYILFVSFLSDASAVTTAFTPPSSSGGGGLVFQKQEEQQQQKHTTLAAAAIKKKKKKVTNKPSFETEIGVQEPLGFYDPLNVLKDAPVEKFDRLRYVEIKHGRICMLAVVGYLYTADAEGGGAAAVGHRLPGYLDKEGLMFTDVPSGLAALNTISLSGIGQIVVFIGILELWVMTDIPNTGNEFVGDFRNGSIDFGWVSSST